MLQAARLSPRILGDSAELVENFIRSRMLPDGGWQDRSGQSDLYYTVFGMEGLRALRADLPSRAIAGYLRQFGDGEGLDLVHLACLARAWVNLPEEMRGSLPADRLLAQIEQHRAGDGGYSLEQGAAHGSIYAAFLSMGAYQDLRRPLPDPARLSASIRRLQTEDGGYANQRDLPVGLAPPTAAAAGLLRQLDEPAPPEVSRWLLGCCLQEGGFAASPLAPVPDLLSTATALHALAGMQVDLDAIREPCLDFIDSLWVNSGGFYGTWDDDLLDTEYTYYGLLALGHLAV